MITENLDCKIKVPLAQTIELFKYNSKDGIEVEQNKFQRFNTKLKKNKCSCKLHHKIFSSKEDLIKQLNELKLPVPIFFEIDILDLIKDKIKDTTGYTLNLGKDLSLLRGVNHILLLIGHANKGQDLYFIDPNYMLPSYDDNDLKSLSNLIILDTDKFWQYVSKPSKQYIKIKCSKKEVKKIKNGLKKFI